MLLESPRGGRRRSDPTWYSAGVKKRESSSRPFAGLKVIDAASWIAAPTAAMILGDLGADVIKIEPPGDGDPYRSLVDNTALPQSGLSHNWIMDGRCKRSLTLNLKSEAAREILRRLVAVCDVFITNLPPGATATAGFGRLEALKETPRVLHNPGLTIQGESITFPVRLEPDWYLEYEGGGPVRVFDPNGFTQAEVQPQGVVPTVRKGNNELTFICDRDRGQGETAKITLFTRGKPLK